MIAHELIKTCADPVDILIVEFDNGTSEEFDLWNTEDCIKSMKYTNKKIDAYSMYDTDQGKTLQIWL